MKTRAFLRRDLKYSIGDSFLFSIMVGSGETFLPAFVLAVGLGQATSGLVATIPFLIASILQLAAPRALVHVGSYRRWVTGLAFVQALSFVPLAWAAWAGDFPESTIFAIVTLYWTCGLAAGPAWNTWMCAVLPNSLRTRYFAFRGRWGQMGLLIGLIAAGVGLDRARQDNRELLAFVVLFLVAGLFRLFSAFCLSRQTERPRLIDEQRAVPWPALIERMKTGRDGRLVIFLAIFNVAVYISSPFFNAFMLRQLELSYFEYMGLVATSFLTKSLVFPHLGRLGQKVGPFRLMQTSVLGTAVLPVLWIVSSDYRWLLAAQVISGVAWAIFELGMTLALLQSIRDEERTGFLSLYNFISAIAIVFGTWIGASVLSSLGESYFAYMVIFAASAAARWGCCILLERFVLPSGERRWMLDTMEWLSALPRQAIRRRRWPAELLMIRRRRSNRRKEDPPTSAAS